MAENVFLLLIPLTLSLTLLLKGCWCHETARMAPFESERIKFYANETRLLIKTDNISLHYNKCLQYRFSLSGKRTKLSSYACRMSTGGRCDAYHFGDDDYHHHQRHDHHTTNTRCHRLRPWMKKDDTFAFYFQFFRRPRHWKDIETMFRRLFRRKRNSRAYRVVGVLKLDGFVDCDDTCRGYDGGEGSEQLSFED